MSHPVYSRQQLLNRGMVKVKKVAADMGVLPSGDKRLINNWVEAILAHQAKTVAKVEQKSAAIEFDGDSYEGLTQPYMVVSEGKIVHRTETYLQAERFVQNAGLVLIEPQEVAQAELEAELETELQVVAIDFGYHEVVKNGDVVATVEIVFDRDHDLVSWAVNKGADRQLFLSYEDAEKFALNDERGSGRINQPIEEIGYIIEDTNYVDLWGQQYSVKFNGTLAGYIWLDDRWGWTLDGEDFFDDWRPVAKNLIKLTKREYATV
jgi:hypothetical protein